MGIPAPTELLLILGIVIMVFGAKRIPEIMGGVAEGIKTFKKSLDDDVNPNQTQTPHDVKSGEQPVGKTQNN